MKLWNDIDAILACPGPSLATYKNGNLCQRRGLLIAALNTAYPLIRPDVWFGYDFPACYDSGLWSEPFMKVTRRICGQLLTSEGDPDSPMVCDSPNVVLVDGARPDSDPFGWMVKQDPTLPFLDLRCSLIMALSFLFRNGVKSVWLAGCDMGGESDYYDDRVLDQARRRENRLLYRQQIGWLRQIQKELQKDGRILGSATPKSPINEFLPYSEVGELPVATRHTRSTPIRDVKTPRPAMAMARWQDVTDDAPDDGVLLGAVAAQEDLLPWWFANYAKSGSKLPVAVASFGLSADAGKTLPPGTQVIECGDVPVEGWLRKPFAILRAPFKKRILWLDLDTEVLGDVSEMLKFARGGDIGISTDLIINNQKPPHWFNHVPIEATYYDTGDIAIERGNPLIEEWAGAIAEHPAGYWTGDHSALSLVLHKKGIYPRIFPSTLHRYCYEGPKVPGLRVVHWCARKGKEHIRREIALLSSPELPIPVGGPLRAESMRMACKIIREECVDSVRILEFGGIRKPFSQKAIDGDGLSTVLWAFLANEKRVGQVVSVDIDPSVPSRCASSLEAMSVSGERVSVETCDAFDYLDRNQPPAVAPFDLIYLDGPGDDMSIPGLRASAEWHVRLAEKCVCLLGAKGPRLMMVDDCKDQHGGRHKAHYVAQFAARNGWELLYSGYQMIWRIPAGHGSN